MELWECDEYVWNVYWLFVIQWRSLPMECRECDGYALDVLNLVENYFFYVISDQTESEFISSHYFVGTN